MRSNQLPGGATMKEKAACNFSESDMEGTGFGSVGQLLQTPQQKEITLQEVLILGRFG